MGALENVINEEILKIWSSIEKVKTFLLKIYLAVLYKLKPASFSAKSFEDVFSLSFAFLPHKIFKTDDFLASVDELRER